MVSPLHQLEIIHYRAALSAGVLDVENVPILALFEFVVILTKAEGADFEIFVSGHIGRHICPPAGVFAGNDIPLSVDFCFKGVLRLSTESIACIGAAENLKADKIGVIHGIFAIGVTNGDEISGFSIRGIAPSFKHDRALAT